MERFVALSLFPVGKTRPTAIRGQTVLRAAKGLEANAVRDQRVG